MPMSETDSQAALALAEQLRKKLEALSKSGIAFELGGKVAEAIDDDDISAAWSFLKSLSESSTSSAIIDLLKSLVEWRSKAEMYTRTKWGASSIEYNRFKKGNEKMLEPFKGRKLVLNQALVSFYNQELEFQELVSGSPPPRWRRALMYVPDIIRIALGLVSR